MKIDITIPMNSQIHSIVFPNHKLKNKRDFLTILIESSRYILNQLQYGGKIKPYNKGYIHLLKSRVSRLYFEDESHCYSIGFPFTISQKDDGSIVGFSLDEVNLLPVVFVGLMQILNGEDWDSTEILDFASPIDDWQSRQLSTLNDSSVNPKNFWRFFRNLMMYDIGYLRHDHSPEQFKPDQPYNHPVDHIHGGYDGDVSYRIGLRNSPAIEDIKDITNPDTDCWMLEKFN